MDYTSSIVSLTYTKGMLRPLDFMNCFFQYNDPIFYCENAALTFVEVLTNVPSHMDSAVTTFSACAPLCIPSGTHLIFNNVTAASLHPFPQLPYQ